MDNSEFYNAEVIDNFLEKITEAKDYLEKHKKRIQTIHFKKKIFEIIDHLFLFIKRDDLVMHIRNEFQEFQDTTIDPQNFGIHETPMPQQEEQYLPILKEILDQQIKILRKQDYYHQETIEACNKNQPLPQRFIEEIKQSSIQQQPIRRKEMMSIQSNLCIVTIKEKKQHVPQMNKQGQQQLEEQKGQKGASRKEDQIDYLNIEEEFKKQEERNAKLQDLQSLVEEEVYELETIESYGGKLNTLIRLQDGRLIAGGRDKKLHVFTSDNKYQQTIDIEDELRFGIEIKGKIYCGIWNKTISVFDSKTLERLASIKTTDSVRKMIAYDDDYIICGEWSGHIEIISVKALKVVQKHQVLMKKTIWDIIKTSNKNEFAFALDNEGQAKKGGLVFLTFVQKAGSFKISENTEEIYFKQESVECIVEIQEGVIMGCIQGNNRIRIADRKEKTDTESIYNISESNSYNAIQKVIGYDQSGFPYVLVKDDTQVSLINTLTYEIYPLIESQFMDYAYGCSMLQARVGRHLKIYTVDYDQAEGIIKEIIFKNVFK